MRIQPFVLMVCVCPAVSLAQHRAAPAAPDLARYDDLLHAVARPTGLDYRAVRARLGELRAFHDALAHDGPTATPSRYPTDAAREAYWIDAYNATVLRAIAEAPPTMRNVLEQPHGGGFFHTRTWRIDGRERTLDAIENTELRARFHDPRVHTALNCGARSCPPLRAGAYDAAHLDAQLDAQASAFVAGVSFDPATHTVTLPQLFEWFAADFAQPVPGHPPVAARPPFGFLYTFARGRQGDALSALCGPDGAQCTVRMTPYDWTLNEAH